MAPIPNPQVIFAKVPVDYPVPGETLKYDPDSETIDLDATPLNGGALVKILYLSIDPYMRSLLREYGGWKLGQPGNGRGVVLVLRSETPKYKVGTYLFARVDWRAYHILPESASNQSTVLDESFGIPLSAYLGVAGMPGQTAFYSLRAFAKWKKGETLFVSSAAGGVGSLVVQLAKLAGLKVIGSAGDAQKIRFLKDELDADVAFNYKTESVWDVLKEHGPVDIYFDNVGGETLDAALLNAAQGGRIIFCGYASEYNRGGKEPYGVKNLVQGVSKSLSMNGFNVGDLVAEAGPEPFVKEVLPLLRDGKIKFQEDKTYGLQHAPEALLGVLTGKNHGKAIVVVAEE